MTTYYTYTLINSLDNQPFYVGKGSGSRMYQHLAETNRDSYIKRSVHSKIINILQNEGDVIYRKVDMETEQAAFDEEKRLILLYGRKDLGTGILHNLTEGGEGASNTNPVSVERRAAKHRGMKRSDESKQRMSEAQQRIAAKNRELYGTGVTPDTIIKMISNRTGKPWSENARSVTRNKPTAKAVVGYSKTTGEFVGRWESISRCGIDLNLDITTIWKICEGTPCVKGGKTRKLYPLKSTKGYVFCYE